MWYPYHIHMNIHIDPLPQRIASSKGLRQGGQNADLSHPPKVRAETEKTSGNCQGPRPQKIGKWPSHSSLVWSLLDSCSENSEWPFGIQQDKPQAGGLGLERIYFESSTLERSSVRPQPNSADSWVWLGLKDPTADSGQFHTLKFVYINCIQKIRWSLMITKNGQDL